MNPIDQTTVEHHGKSITIQWFHDPDTEPPWERSDGHGPVSEWEHRDKRPGERILSTDRGHHRFYDYAAAIKTAKRDGWDAKPYGTGTKAEQAARAVEADFQWLKRWCDDGWHWCGYVVEIDGCDYDDSLWGIDSDSMAQYQETALRDAMAWLDREIAESAATACMDVATVSGGAK